MQRQHVVVPQEIKEGQDGVLITLDEWKLDEKMQKHPSSAARCIDQHVSLIEDGCIKSRIAACFVTRKMTIFMANKVLEEGQYALTCKKVHDNQFGISCMILKAKLGEQDKEQTDHFKVFVTVEFHKTGSKHYSHDYTVELSTLDTNISEVHDNERRFYIHGARQLLNSFAWYVCGKARPMGCLNAGSCIIPPSISLENAYKILQCMKLQVLSPAKEEEVQACLDKEEEHLKYGKEPMYITFHKANLPAEMGIGKAEPTCSALHDLMVVKSYLDPRAKTKAWKVRMRDAMEENPNENVEEEHHGGTRRSVYPVGSLVARHGFLLPTSLASRNAELASFMEKMMPNVYTKEKAGKILLGAYAISQLAFQKPEEHHDQTHFLEEVEGSLMHHVAQITTRILEEYTRHRVLNKGNVDAYKSTHACGAFVSNVMDMGLWDAGLVKGAQRKPHVFVYTVCFPAEKSEGKPKYVFAFCRKNEVKPFAMTGMNFMFRGNLMEEVQQHYQYADAKGTMLERVCSFITAQNEAQEKKPKRMFAIELSILHQLCGMFPNEIGQHKKLLRTILLQKYQQEFAKNTGWVDTSDVCFMTHLLEKTKGDANPFWWTIPYI